ARQELRDLVREWNRLQGLTILLTSHDAGDIEAVCDRVVVVNHGRVVLDGLVNDVRREYLGAKVIHVVFHDKAREINLPGVKILKSEGHSLSLECDDRRTPIQEVITAVMSAGSVADITIEDPPLEEVIAHIYGSKAVKEV